MGSRCFYLDLAKVIATLLVIFGHLYGENSTIRLYIYAFHMPLFFFISGIFHQDTGHIEWVKYCKRILWPTLIFFLLSILLSIFMGRGLVGISNIVKTYLIGLSSGKLSTILWFLFALFWCKIYTDYIILVKRPILTVIGWEAALFIPVLLNRLLPFEMTQGLMAVPFYLLGYLLRKRFPVLKPNFKWSFVFLGSAVLCILITRLHGRVSLGFISFGHLARTQGIDNNSLITYLLSFGGDVVLFYLNGLIGSLMILALALLPYPESPAITAISKSLITVVGTQYLFITPVLHSIGYDPSAWVSIPLSLGIFILCYLMHIILRPIYRIVQ